MKTQREESKNNKKNVLTLIKIDMQRRISILQNCVTSLRAKKINV